MWKLEDGVAQKEHWSCVTLAPLQRWLNGLSTTPIHASPWPMAGAFRRWISVIWMVSTSLFVLQLHDISSHEWPSGVQSCMWLGIRTESPLPEWTRTKHFLQPSMCLGCYHSLDIGDCGMGWWMIVLFPGRRFEDRLAWRNCDWNNARGALKHVARYATTGHAESRRIAGIATSEYECQLEAW
jgi:hypothetical protein